MTKATAQIFGAIEEINPNGEVRVANLWFPLDPKEPTVLGQFVRADLVWNGDETWEVKHADLFDAHKEEIQKLSTPATTEPPAKQERVIEQVQAAPPPKQTATVVNAPRFSAQKDVAQAPEQRLPLPDAPPKSAEQPSAPAVSMQQTGRFGARGQTTSTQPAATAPAASQPGNRFSVTAKVIPMKPPARPVPTTTSRFAATSTKPATARAATNTRPAFDPLVDEDIPF